MPLNKVPWWFFLFLFSHVASAQDITFSCLPCDRFDSLNTLIRDGKIQKAVARILFARGIKELKAFCLAPDQKTATHEIYRFPMQGYGPKAMGEGGKIWYVSKGYDYFDGNLHLAHPAIDIFIRDRNQDFLDDRTGQPVKVLSCIDGIVVAMADSWDSTSNLRGGIYLYIYDPVGNRLFYYAHNSKLLVKTGDRVEAGQAIAFVGRSGFNAYKKRSPTHLHLMVLQIDEKGQPIPVNFADRLKTAAVSTE